MRLSLRYRLILPLTILLIGDLIVTAWAAETAAIAADRRLAHQLWRIARTLSEPRTFPLTERVLQQMKGLSGAEFLLVQRGGLSLSTFAESRSPSPPDVPSLNPLTDANSEPLGPSVDVEGVAYRCLRLTLREPHPNSGDELYIFYPEALRKTAMWEAARPLLVLGGVGGIIAVAFAFILSSRLVHRIQDIDHRTRLIASGDFRPMPLPRSDDELSDLMRSVNDMARRLAAFQDTQQRSERLRLLGQFSGGLAHQLRNASSGAKLAIEVYLSENPNADPEPLQVALQQLSRIEANLRQFLDLGKPPPAKMQPCDVTNILDQVVSMVRPYCLHAGITVVWNSDRVRTMTGDPEQLTHLFNNIISNAIEAAGPGGIVTIRITTLETAFVIEISDTGPGPPDAIQATMFDPFVTQKSQGIGLGLAVAKQAAELHRGRMTWRRQDELTIFRIELPMGPQTELK